MTFDEHFIRRVYRTTAYVGAFALICCVGFGKYIFALGILLGTLFGLAGLWMLELTVKRYLTKDAGGPGSFSLSKLSLLKYPVYLLVLVPVVLSGSIPLIVGFIVGLGLVHLVIILKAVGQVVLQRLDSH